MSKTKKNKKKKWYETGEFADGYQLWDFYRTFKNKKNSEKKDVKKKNKSVLQDKKVTKTKKVQNTTTHLPKVENGKLSFDPIAQFYGFRDETERQNYIKENPQLYVANGGFKYEPSVLQKNYTPISDKKKKAAVEAAKNVVEETNDKSPMTSGDQAMTTEDDYKWFKKGAFADGYQMWDGVKTVGSTIGDVATGAVTGVGKMVEGVADLWLYWNALGAETSTKVLNGVANKSVELAKDAGVTKKTELSPKTMSFMEDYVSFVEKLPDAMREAAKADIFENIMYPVDKWVSKNSVLGGKMDAISEGLGQIAAIIATGGVAGATGLGSAGITALTTGLSGLSSMGNGISEAYNDGASDIEAWGYGTIKGVIDAGTELIFGGLGKGVKALGISKGIGGLDDIFAKSVSSKLAGWIKNPAVRTWIGNSIESTIKAGGEGFEEVLAGIGTAFAKKLTYLSDEDLGELVANEDLLDQFIVGFLVGGIAQSIDFAESTSQSTDVDTGRTADEELAVDKEIDDENRQGHNNKINIQEFIEGLWEGSRNTTNNETAKNVEKSQLESVENYNESGIIELTLDNITKDILKTKPLNSPKPDRWISSGGSISIDNGDWVYTNADGISVKYVDGYPDFKGAGLVIQEVDVVEFVSRAIDKRKAREVVEQGENTVWHHPPDGHMLQEIDANIHSQFTHIGGIARMKKGE